MDKIFDQAKDLHVANYVVYGDSTDNKLYFEETGENKTEVAAADAMDAFKKGRLVVKTEDGFFVPISIDDNQVVVIVYDSSSATPVTAQAFTFKSGN